MSHETSSEKKDDSDLRGASGTGMASGQALGEKVAVPRSDESTDTASTVTDGVDRDDDGRDGDGGAVEQVESHASTTIPYSKARCIALVATVTGAAFNNVSRVNKRMVSKRCRSGRHS